VKVADIVTMARTAVERDYRGEVIDAHAPEMPTRFAKQLTQMVRGGIAIGLSRERAMRLAIRCALDSIPPLRLEIILDVAANPETYPNAVRNRIDKPWSTIKREMEALHILGILRCDEEARMQMDLTDKTGMSEKRTWRYSLSDGYDEETLLGMTAVKAKQAGKANGHGGAGAFQGMVDTAANSNTASSGTGHRHPRRRAGGVRRPGEVEGGLSVTGANYHQKCE
jgi:hypothetical protein